MEKQIDEITYIAPVVNCIQEFLPENWKDLRLRLNINKGFYEIYFYVNTNGQWWYSLDLWKLFSIDMDKFDDLYNEMCDKIYDLCIDDQQEKQWTSCTINVLNTGKFDLEFEYDDRIEHEDWLKKQKIEHIKR